MRSCTPPPSIRSYEQALARWEAIKVWVGAWKPIKGDRRRDNMLMMLRSNGDIELKFYETVCVTYHEDGDITVQGYPTMSTTSFIDALTPTGISHQLGVEGMNPILVLRGQNHGCNWQTWWRRGLVVRCSDPVRLHYCAEDNQWRPRDESQLTRFEWTVPITAKARAASKAYHLGDFLKAVPALDALGGIQRMNPPDANCALDRLANRDFAGALAFCPRGESCTVFGKPHWRSEPTPISSAFVDQMRACIYDEHGALTRVEKPVVTLGEYEQWRRSRRCFSLVC